MNFVLEIIASGYSSHRPPSHFHECSIDGKSIATFHKEMGRAKNEEGRGLEWGETTIDLQQSKTPIKVSIAAAELAWGKAGDPTLKEKGRINYIIKAQADTALVRLYSVSDRYLTMSEVKHWFPEYNAQG
jgi:hypothetical protein